MKKMEKTGCALLVAIAVLILAGCPQEVVEDPSGDAGLNSITIKDVSVRVPEGAGRDVWLAGDFQVSSMDVAEALFPASLFTGDEIPEAAVNVGPAGSDAEIWFIKVSGEKKPAVDDPGWTRESSFTFKERDSLYIQVTSADKRAQNYYRVRINKLSNDAGLSALTIGDKSVGLLNISGANAINDVTMAETTLIFGEQNINVPVDTVKKDRLASVQYGVLKAGNSAVEPE
jgi:hypothetical protein